MLPVRTDPNVEDWMVRPFISFGIFVLLQLTKSQYNVIYLLIQIRFLLSLDTFPDPIFFRHKAFFVSKISMNKIFGKKTVLGQKKILDQLSVGHETFGPNIYFAPKVFYPKIIWT